MNQSQQIQGDDSVFLVGRPPIDEYLGFISTQPVDAQSADLKNLSEEWRQANDHVKELQNTEPAWADNAPVTPIPLGLAHLTQLVLNDPIFQKSFDIVPVELAYVELDRLVVFQKYINLVHSNRLVQLLGKNSSEEQVFRLCMPFEHTVLPFQVLRISNNAFDFVSRSSDLRFLDPFLCQPEQLTQYQPSGPLAGVIGLPVGYGSNYFNAISVEGRLILNNGSHRAYALRELGLTHAPCVIQKVTRREELTVIAHKALLQHQDLYISQPRPPVLKDYFDPKLRKLIRIAPKARHVRVSFGIEQIDLPESQL
jgi:hypothetical protein